MTNGPPNTDHWCNVTQYGFASAAICAFIICWFFILFRPMQGAFLLKKTSAASKIILPSLFVSLVLAVFTVVASIILSSGYANWCHHISKALGKCSKADYVLHNSNSYMMTQTIGPSHPTPFTAYLISAQVFAWLGSTCWIGNVVLLGSRVFLHMDFPDYFFKPSFTRKYSRMSSTASGPNGIGKSTTSVIEQQPPLEDQASKMKKFKSARAFSSFDSFVEVDSV